MMVMMMMTMTVKRDKHTNYRKRLHPWQESDVGGGMDEWNFLSVSRSPLCIFDRLRT